MSFLLAHSGSAPFSEERFADAEDTLNLNGTLSIESSTVEGCRIAVSHHPDAPLAGTRLYEDDSWLISIAGDLIDHRSPPFQLVKEILESATYSDFQELAGMFGIVAFQRKQRRLYMVSDRISQYPLFYLNRDRGLTVTSQLAAFCRLHEGLFFNEKWLWEYLYINLPVGSTTFLKGVSKLPAATLLTYDLDSDTQSLQEYAPPFKPAAKMPTERDALDRALEVFNDRVPRYFEGAEQVACPLTSGWDGRTLIAFAPQQPHRIYTYGVEGCSDVVKAQETARKMNWPHHTIPFGEAFVNSLPELAWRTVYLSSGLEKITRSSLLYMYAQLTDGARECPLTISGVAFDVFFRGHMAPGPLASPGLVDLFEGSASEPAMGHLEGILQVSETEVARHLGSRLNSLKEIHGPFTDPAFHLAFGLYSLCPGYFSGEMTLAGNFTTVRVPVFDPHIIRLAYETPLSTLRFSEFTTHKRGSREEAVLQAWLLKNVSPELYRLPIGSTRPDMVLRGDAVFQAYRGMQSIRRRISRRLGFEQEPSRLEDWQAWLGVHHRTFLDRLVFAPESRIREYIRGEFLEELRNSTDRVILAKLARVEMILRLIESDWRLDPGMMES